MVLYFSDQDIFLVKDTFFNECSDALQYLFIIQLNEFLIVGVKILDAVYFLILIFLSFSDVGLSPVGGGGGAEAHPARNISGARIAAAHRRIADRMRDLR